MNDWKYNANMLNEEEWKEIYFSVMNGLKNNYRNYELYVVLAEYYRRTNLNQAYLCLETAELYCNVEEDRECIIRCKNELKKYGEVDVQPVSIVIVSYNCKQMMIDCINSIRANNLCSSYQMIVVDNASNDGIVEWLRQQPDIMLIENEENKGFAAASNQGVRASESANDILFLNNDTLITPNAIFWLRMGLYENDRIGAAGSVSNFVGNGQHITEVFNTVGEYIRYGEENNVPQKNPYEKKIWLSGFALLMKRKALNKIGLFDETYGKGYYEDNDIGIRLQYAGYQCLLCRNSFIFHYGSQGFGKNVNLHEVLMHNNREKFWTKWGFDIEEYSYPKHEIINMISQKKEETIRILEIGCGCGATLSKIQYLWPNAKVYGIETKKELADISGNYLDVSQGNVEIMGFPYEENYFDYIILSDVWNNLVDPIKMIEKVKPYLKEGAVILACIPNSLYISAMLPILKDGITYKKYKPVYTLNSIVDMFQKCDLKIEEVQWIPGTDVHDVNDENVLEVLAQIYDVDNQYQFQAYQYIVKAVCVTGM